jgi:polyisoprenoid-binding protein YceI/rhodanese-related sulfurtransferase
MNTTLVDTTSLKELLGTTPPPVLMDVRLEEDFTAAHLPGAKNNCVFEVAFLERMTSLAPDPQTQVCVYGEAADSLESRVAFEKLQRAGYTQVLEFREGLQGWKAAGFSVEGNAPADAASGPAIADGTHQLDLTESRVEWTGRNLLNKHQGRLAIKDGCLRFEGGQLTGGEIIFDMTDIGCHDLSGNPLHDVLIAHLRSDDFFDVELYPTARFAILSATPVPDAKPGEPNLAVKGELSLKNVTDSIEFTAAAGLTAEGKPAAQAAFAFDRTKWNVLYGSGRFFHRLGGHLVNSMIELQIRMVAR